MSDTLNFIIPGFTMSASEFNFENCQVLENPGLGSRAAESSFYSLADIAEDHLQTITKVLHSKSGNDSSLRIIGMSMGGMILSYLASVHRSRLPQKCQFYFLVTSPNLPNNPAVPDTLLASWQNVEAGSVASFASMLADFFANDFRLNHPTKAEDYYRYHAEGGNRQSGKNFYLQLKALRQADLAANYQSLDPSECKFIGGKEDYILGPSHSKDLQRLVPKSSHEEIAGLGHMINIERRDIIESILDGSL